MQNRTAIYTCLTRTSGELVLDLRKQVEASGDLVVGTFTDHCAEGQRRHSRAGWKALLASLDGVDQIAVPSAGDLPGKTVQDLLRLLGTLRDHGVGLLLLHEGIDTGNGSAFSLLGIVEAYRAAKLSQAIKAGQKKALEAGKSIGRPEVPPSIRHRIQACLAAGHGIRPTAKNFNVSPGTVVNIRRSMAVSLSQQAA